MKINPRAYAKELEHWIKALEGFVDRASLTPLKEMPERLLQGADRGKQFDWATSRPVKLKPATEYDRAQGTTERVQVTWSFRACFSPDSRAKDKKKSLWDLQVLNTQVEIYGPPDLTKLILKFHHDMKNKGQLGPHIHMQISEKFLGDIVGTRLAVPRFPSISLLPTDCLDMLLSEFFPHEWPKEQSGATHINLLRNSQIERAKRLAHELTRHWRDNPRRTPVSLLQETYIPDFHIA